MSRSARSLPPACTPRGGDGPDVRFVPAARRCARRRRRRGRRCCSTWAGSPATSRCSPPATATRYRWSGPSFTARTATGRRSGTGEDVFYGHVLGCKGLERRAVVLCVNETEVRDRARERLYVGMSRATDQLDRGRRPGGREGDGRTGRGQPPRPDLSVGWATDLGERLPRPRPVAGSVPGVPQPAFQISPVSVTMYAVWPMISNDVGRSSPLRTGVIVPSCRTLTREPVPGLAGEPSGLPGVKVPCDKA